MRIGISTSVVQRGRTGIAQYLFALLRAMLPAAANHQFVLFVLEEDRPLFKFASPVMDIVPVPERFRQPVSDIVWHQVALPRLARDYRLDVLHIPSSRRMLWRRPCPLVTTIHDLASFSLRRKYDRLRMFYGRSVVPRLALRQDQIIAISANTAADIDRFLHVPRERVTVVYNGLDHQRFFPGSKSGARAEAARQYQLDGPFFLYVARLEHPAKNHVRLIAAYNRFKAATRSRWQLAFGGSDWHRARAIHDAAADSPFARDIRFLGFVPDDALPDLYRAADVVVYPSLYEGFGLPPLEAMACGTPVISSDRGSLGEVVDHAAAIVNPEDVESIAAQLTALATDGGARDRWRRAGLARAPQFDWRQTAAATLKVYERAAARLPSARCETDDEPSPGPAPSREADASRPTPALP